MKRSRAALLLLLVLLAPHALAQAPHPDPFELTVRVAIWPSGHIDASCSSLNGTLNKACTLLQEVLAHNAVTVRYPRAINLQSDDVTPVTPVGAEVMDAVARLLGGPAPARQAPLETSSSQAQQGEEPIVVELRLRWGGAESSSGIVACVSLSSRQWICASEISFSAGEAAALAGDRSVEVVVALARAMAGAVPPLPAASAPALAIDVGEAARDVLAASARADPDVDPTLPGTGAATIALLPPDDPREPREDPLVDASVETTGGLGESSLVVAAAPADPPAEAPAAAAPASAERAARPGTAAREKAAHATGEAAPSSTRGQPGEPPAPIAAASPPRATPGARTASAVAPAAGPATALAASAAAAGALLLLALGLYSRLRASRLAEQGTRERILAIVRAAPGLTPGAVARRAERHENTIRYHLGVLERNGYVSSHWHGGRQLFFSAGEASPERVRDAGALRTDAARRLYEAARATPGIGIAQACALVGLHRTTLHYHAKRLERAGVLTLSKEADGLRLFARG